MKHPSPREVPTRRPGLRPENALWGGSPLQHRFCVGSFHVTAVLHASDPERGYDVVERICLILTANE